MKCARLCSISAAADMGREFSGAKSLKIDAADIDSAEARAAIEAAARMLREGKLVAFPTETVYGLGANALDAQAVAAVFAAKGRPQDNPLILHVSGEEDALSLVDEASPIARRLMSAFWPGPLTILFRRRDGLADYITAGLDTVALRCPSHPVARALIAEAGVPVAAPSANRSGRPSPTLASHVAEDLGDCVAAIIDGGAAMIGVESTVVDATGAKARILRPGGVSLDELAAVLGPESVEGAEHGEVDGNCVEAGSGAAAAVSRDCAEGGRGDAEPCGGVEGGSVAAVSSHADGVALRAARDASTANAARDASTANAARDASAANAASDASTARVARDASGMIAAEAASLAAGCASDAGDETGSAASMRAPQSEAAGSSACQDAGSAVDGRPRSPGLKYRHYSPEAPTLLIGGAAHPVAHRMAKIAESAMTSGRFVGFGGMPPRSGRETRVAVIAANETLEMAKAYLGGGAAERLIALPLGAAGDQSAAARALFGALRLADAGAADLVLCERPSGRGGLTDALQDRMDRASGCGEAPASGAAAPAPAYAAPPASPSAPTAAAPAHAAAVHIGPFATRGAAWVDVGLTREILFVCTGNTCRSAMAEALFNARAGHARAAAPATSDSVASQGGSGGARTQLVSQPVPAAYSVSNPNPNPNPNPQSPAQGGSGAAPLWRASSAGLSARDGAGAAQYAALAAKKLGGDLSGHRARTLDIDILDSADIVLAMTRDHRDAINARWPRHRHKVFCITDYALAEPRIAGVAPQAACAANEAVGAAPNGAGGACGIDDPYGGSEALYEASASRILEAVTGVMRALLI